MYELNRICVSFGHLGDASVQTVGNHFYSLALPVCININHTPTDIRLKRTKLSAIKWVQPFKSDFMFSFKKKKKRLVADLNAKARYMRYCLAPLFPICF